MQRFLGQAARWFGKGRESGGQQTRRRSTFRPALEQLESRQLLSVTYHGGPLLQNVQAETVFYGQDWYYNSTLYNSAVQLDNVLNDVTQSSYMNMLGEYGVGSGQFQDGVIDLNNPPRGWVVDDSEIRAMLDNFIGQGYLQPPSNNQLYIVYTTPNVVVTKGNQDSQHDFLGYHNTFVDPYYGSIYYAVIAHPIGNADIPGMNYFQQQTTVTSHELAEAVTDPDVRSGWYDDRTGNEIGDFCTQYFGLLHGYVIQAEYSNYYNACVIPGDADPFYPGGGAPGHGDCHCGDGAVISNLTHPVSSPATPLQEPAVAEPGHQGHAVDHGAWLAALKNTRHENAVDALFLSADSVGWLDGHAL
jgi:hypothetical protein